MAGDEDVSRLRIGLQMKRLAEVVRPVLASLESDTASLPPIAGNEKAAYALRVALLALLDAMFDWLEPQHESFAARDDLNVAYTTLTLLLMRPEFDATSLQLDASGRAQCDAPTLSAARNYRRLLHKALHFVALHLGLATQLSSTQPFTLFAVRTLAACYFRVPGNALLVLSFFLSVMHVFIVVHSILKL